jgi:hypothetical protein
MSKILKDEEFSLWLNDFFLFFISPDFELEPGKVSDRTDGKLVHLDGLNFSRAWGLYGLSDFPELDHLKHVANSHVNYSINDIADGSYEGEHWLASFALYALIAGSGTN